MTQYSARLRIPTPDEGDTPVDLPAVWTSRAVILDTLVPGDAGPITSRPTSTPGTPGITSRLFVVTDQPNSPRLDADTGNGWFTVGPAQADQPAAVASLRTLGPGAQQAAAGNDPRLIGGGNASGDVNGTYPGPLSVVSWGGQTKGQVVAGSPPQTHAPSHAPGGSDPLSGLTDANFAAANKDGAAGTASLRTLGAGSSQAMPGNATPTPGAHAASHKYSGSDPLVLLKPTVQAANYAAAVDDYVLMSGSNNTVTLPNAPSVDGAACAVMAITAGVVVNRAGTDTITTSAQGQLTVTVAQGTTVIFTYHNGVWYGLVTGGGSGASGLVALSPPSRAYCSVNSGPYGPSVWTQVPIDSRSYDPSGMINTSTHQFVIQTAGYYHVDAMITSNSGAVAYTPGIYHNGSLYAEGQYTSTANNATVSDVVQCNAGDTLSLYLFNGSGANLNVAGINQYYTYMTVTQVAQIGSPPAGQGLTTIARASWGGSTASGGAWTKFPLNTITFDPGNNFSTTNSRYICPATGYYQVNTLFGGAPGPAATNVSGNLAIYKNGAAVITGHMVSETDTAGWVAADLSDVIYCQAGDNLEFWYSVSGAWANSTAYMSVFQVAGSSIFGALSPTAQNAAYTAGAGQLVLMTGANAVTLPAGPIPGSQIEVQALTAQVPVNRGGTDTINNAGVAGLQSLTVNAGQSVIFSYLGGVWYASPVGAGQNLAPPARASGSTSGNVTANAWTKITLANKDLDPGGNFDTTTNHRYVAPTTGYYEVEVSVGLNASAAGQGCEPAIYKNGAAVSYGPNVESQAAGNLGSSATDIVQLNAGDYVELYVFCNAALGLLGGTGSTQYTWMSVHQVGVIGAPAPGQGQATVARMYRNAAFNIPAAAWTKLPLDTVSYDPGNNTVIGASRYVCPATGYFEIDGQLELAAGANSQTIVSVYKNGTEAARGNTAGAATGQISFTVGDVLSCNAGDYLELYCYSTNGQAIAGGSSPVNYFSVRQVAGSNLIAALSPTSQSAAYSAGAGQRVLMTGANAVTLPNAPMNGSQVAVVSLTGRVPINRSGTDTITVYSQTGQTSITLPVYQQVVLQYLNGVWYVIDGMETKPLVAALPTNPADGEEIRFLADATNGVVWHFRYNAGSASAYKWEYIGGSAMRAEVDNLETTTTADGVFHDLVTLGPSIILPLAGDYEMVFDAFVSINGNAVALSASVGPLIGVTAVNANDVATVVNPVANQYLNAQIGRTLKRTVTPANTSVRLQYASNNANTRFNLRELQIRPVRVG